MARFGLLLLQELALRGDEAAVVVIVKTGDASGVAIGRETIEKRPAP